MRRQLLGLLIHFSAFLRKSANSRRNPSFPQKLSSSTHAFWAILTFLSFFNKFFSSPNRIRRKYIVNTDIMIFEKTESTITTENSADAIITESAKTWTSPLAAPKAPNSNRLKITTKIESSKNGLSGHSKFGVRTQLSQHSNNERSDLLTKRQNFKALFEAGLRG